MTSGVTGAASAAVKATPVIAAAGAASGNDSFWAAPIATLGKGVTSVAGSVAANIADARRTDTAINTRTVNSGLYGAASSIMDKLTGFGTSALNTVSSWLDNKTTQTLDRASTSLYESLYGKTERPVVGTSENIPTNTTGIGNTFLSGGADPYAFINSLGGGYLPTPTESTVIVPTAGGRSMPAWIMPAVVGLIVFMLIPKKG
jgi:hypothetical protein